jgi:hypothetical protein
MRNTCVGDADFLYSSLRVAFTYPATTLLESHNTTYAQVSAVERLCLSESIDVLYLVLYTLFCEEKKVTPFWIRPSNLGVIKWTLSVESRTRL